MKQNVVMIRKMGSFDVSQRTKDDMFNATLLLKQWNQSHNSKKEIKDYFDNKATQEYIEVLNKDESVMGGIVPMIKSKANKGENMGTWMHPFLFIDFCMWINPKFKFDVIKFVYDELIKHRKDAGDGYVSLSASGIKLKDYNFAEIAVALQWIVFGMKGKNLRQTATQEQLKELYELEQKLAFAIDMGYITTYQQLLSELRKIWNTKNSKF